MKIVLLRAGDAQLAKVTKALGAKERARRGRLTKEALLEEHFNTKPCTCQPQGRCYALMKDLLARNNLDGVLQRDVLGALRTGRAKKRVVCLVGGTDCGKSFLFGGFEEVFQTYTRPEGGSYQLETLLDKELVLLNDFEYDAKAKDWMPWQYFKNFLEGRPVSVALPKNRGGDKLFTAKVPVLMTAPQEVTLKRYGHEDFREKEQMDRRILYRYCTYSIPQGERQEVSQHCGHCTAKLYLEGREPSGSAAPNDHAGLSDGPPQHSTASDGPPPKRARTAAECVKELKDLKELLDAGVLSETEFQDLKTRLLEGR